MTASLQESEGGGQGMLLGNGFGTVIDSTHRSRISISTVWSSWSMCLYLSTLILYPSTSFPRQSCYRKESKRSDSSCELISRFSARRKPSLKDCSSQIARIRRTSSYSTAFSSRSRYLYPRYLASRSFAYCRSCISHRSPLGSQRFSSSSARWLKRSLRMGGRLGWRLVQSASPVHLRVSSLLSEGGRSFLFLRTVSPGDSEGVGRWCWGWGRGVWASRCCLAAESLREILLISSSMRWKREECRRRGVRQSFISLIIKLSTQTHLRPTQKHQSNVSLTDQL